MKKKLTIAVALAAFALPLAAQDWSLGVGTGPFVFGDFLERRLSPSSGPGPTEPHTLVLSAGTRAGLAVDLERNLADRWAVRFEGTFTRSPLVVRQDGDDDEGTRISAGDLDVATFMVPLVFRINPRGTFRFHLLGGPAAAVYRLGDPELPNADQAFEGTQYEWGVAFGGGVGWWLSDRFAIEANITDTITSSPVDEEKFDDQPGVEVPRPHNAHGTIGVRWRF
jgi:hypothetical protein